MDNIYHDYWEQELMYQFITEDKCRKKAYVLSGEFLEEKNTAVFSLVEGVSLRTQKGMAQS